jgi:hypothetical protein
MSYRPAAGWPIENEHQIVARAGWTDRPQNQAHDWLEWLV